MFLSQSSSCPISLSLSNISNVWGGGTVLKKSKGNPCLKTLDVSQLFVADAPIKKNDLPHLRAVLFSVGKIAHALEG